MCKILFIVRQSDSKRILAARTSYSSAKAVAMIKYKQVRTEVRGIVPTQDGWKTAQVLSNPINY
jgi:hypothetical protein